MDINSQLAQQQVPTGSRSSSSQSSHGVTASNERISAHRSAIEDVDPFAAVLEADMRSTGRSYFEIAIDVESSFM